MADPVCFHLSTKEQTTHSVQMLVTLCYGVQPLVITIVIANGETVSQTVSFSLEVILLSQEKCFYM